MVAVGGQLCGVLAIADALKPEARGVVAALAQKGLTCHLVTGDNWRVARAVSAQLGIVNVTAECLPAAKAAKIRVRSWLSGSASNRPAGIPSCSVTLHLAAAMQSGASAAACPASPSYV